jgi:hypothetical protein
MYILGRSGRKIIIVLLITLALLVIALAAVLHSSRFKSWLLVEISLRSGFAVSAESFAFRLPFAIVANSVEVSHAGEFHFKAPRLDASVNLWSRSVEKLVVDQPTLSLDIDEVMKSSTKGAREFALRDLIVQGGAIVLMRGADTLIELTKIDLQARDLNLAAQSGIALTADVPQLNGTAELRVTGERRDFSAELSLRPKQQSGLFSSRQPAAEVMRLQLKVQMPQEQPVNALIMSKFHGLEVAGDNFTGSLDARVSIDAQITTANFTGKATIADFSGNFPNLPMKLIDGDLTANFAGQYSIANKFFALKALQLSAPFANAVGEGQILLGTEPTIANAKLLVRDISMAMLKVNLPVPLNQWTYQGLAKLSLEAQGPWRALKLKGVIESDSVQLHSDDLALVIVALSAPFEWSPPALRVKEMKLRATKWSYLPKERWHAAAERLAVVSSFEYQANQPIKIAGRLEIAGMKFTSPDSAKIGENLSINGPFELTANGEKQTISVAGKFTADAGELLWGKFFAELKSQKPALDLDADYLRAEDRLHCRRCSLNLASVGLLELTGTVERVSDVPELRVRVSSGNFTPSGFFEFFLRETFNRQYPVLDKLAVAGQMGFDLKLDGELDALSAAGELSLKGGELGAKSNDWRIGPIALNLPLQIHLAESKAAASAAPRTGTLAIERIRFADQTIAPIAATISLSNNALRLHQPIRLGLFGGDIEIENLLWPDLINDPKRVSFSAETKGLKLDDLTQAMNWPRFSGTLTGSIPEVQSAENLLRTRGEIQAELFGGRIRLSKLEIDNPFSGLASLKLDAKLNDIQLEQLTQTFAFGRISGTLEGSIDNLVLTDGQPSELSADLHSVDRRGEQRISVEALNKITVLSSGEDAGALYGGLAGLFDSFRYSKLGFKATLKNDRLTLRGVESRNNQEMLVVGSFLPPTVNVVSHTQNIAFSELVRRLERINKSDNPGVK